MTRPPPRWRAGGGDRHFGHGSVGPVFAARTGPSRRACRSWDEGRLSEHTPVPSPLSPERTTVPTRSPIRRFIPPAVRPARACGTLSPRPRRQEEQHALTRRALAAPQCEGTSPHHVDLGAGVERRTPAAGPVDRQVVGAYATKGPRFPQGPSWFGMVLWAPISRPTKLPPPLANLSCEAPSQHRLRFCKTRTITLSYVRSQ
jgi:hypothetical protein